MKRRISAALLTLCLLMSLMPTVAFAAPNGTFDDVDGHWGQNAIERWAGYGVVNGYENGDFRPENQMTRAEFATMLANMLGYKTMATNTFPDVSESDWFYESILKLAAAGVIQGANGYANPNSPITREEAAVMMCRAFNIPTSGGSLDFADSANVASWARGAVAALAERGMMNGVGNNLIAPQANINRASVATLVDNMITEYVTADTTISGKVDGLVLVVGDATVTVQDAELTENLIVAPKADGAEVILAGTTTAGDVYVDAAATVTVESTAAAGEVQVGAANSTVEVAGKADAVTVTDSADGTAVNVNEGATVGDVAVEANDATVTVAKDAAVDKVAVSGDNADVQVSGKVDNITVDASATGTDVVANSGATVGKVETAGTDTTVSGNGKVENVTATGGTAAVTTPNTNVENKTDSKDNVTNNGTPVPPETGSTTPTPPSSGGSSGGTTNPPATTYTVTVSGGITSGTISVDKESAAAGATVTVKGTPDAEFALKSVTVTQEAASAPEGGDEGAPEGGGASAQAEGTPVETTEITNNQCTFVMPAGNVTVTGTFEKPLENFGVYVVKDATEYKKLPEAFRAWEKDNGATDDGWSNLATNPWLAITGTLKGETLTKDGYANTVDRAGTVNITFTSNGTTTSVDAPWDGVAVGSRGALTAYIGSAVEAGGDALNVTGNAGTFTVTLTYQGATYTGTASYVKPGVETVDVTFANSDIAKQTVAKGEKATKPDVPTKAGYTFDKWVTEENGETEFDFATAISEATTVYAKWIANTYTIKFDLQNGTGTAADITDVAYDSASELTLPANPTREGYTFKEWNTKADGTGTKLEASTKNLSATNGATVTVYAIWEKDSEASLATFVNMDDTIFNVYKSLTSSFGKDIPAAFSSFVDGTLTFTPGQNTEANKITVAGTLNEITTKWTGFNEEKAEEQTGYYLPLMFAAPEGVTNQTSGVSIQSVNGERNKTFDASALDKSGNTYYFSVFLYVDTKDVDGKKVAANTPTFKINWGEGYEETTYTLNLSGLTLKAADTTVVE